MARFFGTLKGARGQATRCGSTSSGMEAIAASWSGAVRATAYASNGADRDSVDVSFITWHGGAGVSLPVYRGPVDPTTAELVAGLFPNDLNANPSALRQLARDLNGRANRLEEARGGRDRAACIVRAIEQYGTDDVAVDEDAALSETDLGAWVQAWVFVADEPDAERAS